MRNSMLMIVLTLVMATGYGFAAEGKKGVDKALPSAQTPSSQTADEKAVRSTGQAFTSAFNKGDAKAIAVLWTGDCEYTDETGRSIQGRDAIEKEYAAFFAANPGLKVEISISSVNIIAGHSAIENGTAVVKKADGAIVSRGSYTAVHLKEQGKWLMASVREHASPTLSQRPSFGDLEWLIGDWSATKGSNTLDFSFKWIAEKKFVELMYSVRDKDTLLRSGIQIIGRDPSSGDVISWSFDSTGGYGRGQWRLLKKGFVIESRGMMPDGALTTSNEIVSRIDGDSFFWQSANRSVAGLSLNDQEPVVLKRKGR
ncbi:MAG: YybH family protein [Desulfomonilaceae bacterium]